MVKRGHSFRHIRTGIICIYSRSPSRGKQTVTRAVAAATGFPRAERFLHRVRMGGIGSRNLVGYDEVELPVRGCQKLPSESL